MADFTTILAAANSAEVAEHLENADHLEGLEGDAGGHEGPSSLGLEAGGWVGLAMLAFLAVLAWKGVHKVIAGGLDKKIAEIRNQLDEARKLRTEAEALRAEYAAKIANAEKDAVAMLEHAEAEAKAIVDKAEADAKAVVGRRKQMAEDKIAAAERAAVEDLRARAAQASATAAGKLIAQRHDADADKALVDKAISSV